MTVFIVQVLYEGILFGADRNITTTSREPGDNETIIKITGQSERPKVLKWPNNKALIGYAGSATLGSMTTDEWLYDFIGRNLDLTDFQSLSEQLIIEVQEQKIIDDEGRDPSVLLIHIAGFESRDEIYVPVVWYIRNSHRLDPEEGYTDVRNDFEATEEVWKKEYISDSTPQDIRNFLGLRARNYNPLWFHHAYDLGVFNLFDSFLMSSFKILIDQHPEHVFPRTLEEWEKHLRMAILTYGAYFKSFYIPGKQYVGGGADIVSLPWPE